MIGRRQPDSRLFSRQLTMTFDNRLRFVVPLICVLFPVLCCGPAVCRGEDVHFIVGDYMQAEGGSWDASTSPLKNPFGVDFDSEGIMYVVELGGGRVYRIDDGKVTRIGQHSGLENKNGRIHVINDGSKGVFVFGNRYAPDHFEGYVPDTNLTEVDMLAQY